MRNHQLIVLVTEKILGSTWQKAWGPNPECKTSAESLLSPPIPEPKGQQGV